MKPIKWIGLAAVVIGSCTTGSFILSNRPVRVASIEHRVADAPAFTEKKELNPYQTESMEWHIWNYLKIHGTSEIAMSADMVYCASIAKGKAKDENDAQQKRVYEKLTAYFIGQAYRKIETTTNNARYSPLEEYIKVLQYLNPKADAKSLVKTGKDIERNKIEVVDIHKLRNFLKATYKATCAEHGITGGTVYVPLIGEVTLPKPKSL
jgi:hypothetical protein